LATLNYLGALGNEGDLTVLGITMAELPLDPQVNVPAPRTKHDENLIWLQLAKALVVSPEFGCSVEILTIVSMLSGMAAVSLALLV
jgi:pre-mRNA-splicing factor ATP-dependent RNA helicase DHX15/PRP43